MRIEIMHLAQTYCILQAGLKGFEKFVTSILRQYNLTS